MTKQQWDAIKTRDPSFDGQFYYALKTAKTLCRPSCSARKAAPENILIFRTLDEGLSAGFHPCPRCRPDLPEWQGAKAELAKRAKEYIHGHYTEKFSLEKIAGALFVDKIYLSKCFKEAAGSTLLRYHNQTRCEEAERMLTETDYSIESIGSRVGFLTPSHFARIFKTFYGQTPSEYKKNYLKTLI